MIRRPAFKCLRYLCLLKGQYEKQCAFASIGYTTLKLAPVCSWKGVLVTAILWLCNSFAILTTQAPNFGEMVQNPTFSQVLGKHQILRKVTNHYLTLEKVRRFPQNQEANRIRRDFRSTLWKFL